MPFATQVAMMGGNLRVGLEDSLYIGKGKFASSDAQQVIGIRPVIEESGLQAANTDQARERPALKGPGEVKF